MSIQVLLPKDIMIKQLCICISNDDLPINYQTKDGEIKGRNSEMLQSGILKEPVSQCLKLIKSIFAEKDAKLRKGITTKLDYARTVLDGNYQAWLLIRDLFGVKDDFRVPKSDMSKSIEGDLNESIKVAFARRGTWVSKMESQRAMNDIALMIPTFSKLETLAVELEEVRDRFNSQMSKLNAEWKRNGKYGVIKVPKVFSDKKRITYYQVGSVVVIYVKDPKRGKTCRIMSNTHFSRVVEFIRSTACFSISMCYIKGLDTTEGALLHVIRKLIEVGLKYPNAVGGIYKSARQLLFLDGDKNAVMGASPRSLYLGGLTGGKLELAEEIAEHLLSCTGDRKSSINLANVFKLVIHPDAEMSDVFDSIKGVHHPNIVNPMNFARFEGIARKAIYASLAAQKIDIRVVPKDPTNVANSSFANSINSTSVPISTIMQAGFTKWAGIEFLPPRGFYDDDRQDIPVSNKSSAPDAKIDKKIFETINNPKTIADLKKVRERLRAINDVVTVLSGTSNLNYKEAKKRFKSVIKAHKQFEQSYIRDGLSIDDISWEDLEAFVLSDTDNSYSVGTEPKLGEVHKEVTRMFYMAEQALKIMTQVCERFTKKVISKASGISIVKSFRARRKELEAMLNAFTGMVSTDEGEVSALMISFDMSEFSKKFPNSLIRILGKVLSELSGEDWMARIDIFFRASVVYNSTRGFSEVTSGIKGGFEGFLNFLWTLAMRVVMDIATQSTGVEGVLAVYSDDGLLRLYISGSKDEVKNKVLLIKDVFASYGLIFHLDKTVASYEILEYLGVFAEKGMIISTWVKELMSIGKRKQSPGLETIADKVQLWDSQTSALVKAGGPPDIAIILSTFLTVRTLRRLNLTTNSSILATLTLIPFSAGGFRVTSISEKCLLSAIEPLSEFTADLQLLTELYPTYAHCIAYIVLGSLKSGKESETSLLSGSLLQTSIIDTSGMGIIRSLIESSGLDSKMTENPLTNKVKASLLRDIKNSRNFTPRDIKHMVQEVPDMIEYNKSIAIMKSSAALKFVTKENISKAQRKDTNLCKSAIRFWSEELRNFNSDGKTIKGSDLTARIIDISYKEYQLARLKESPRTALVPTKVDPDILTNFESTSNESINYQEYIEPEAKFLGAQLTPEYSAESTASTKQRRNDRFVATASRIVASNPSMLNLYYSIANAFKLPCPALPVYSVVTSHRSSKNFGEAAVATYLPTPFHALISSRMSNKMWDALSNKERTDRTTYVEAARISTYLGTFYRLNNMSKLNNIVLPINYNINDIEYNTLNPVLDMRTMPEPELIDAKTTKSFHSTLIEQSSQESSLESSVFTAGVMSSLIDSYSVKGILLNRLQSWLYSCLNGNLNASPSKCPAHIPSNWMSQIYLEATVQVSFRLCSPLTRSRLIKAISPFLRDTQGQSTVESISDNYKLNAYVKCLESVKSDVEIFQGHVSKVAGAVACLEMDESLKHRLLTVDIFTNSDGLYFINVAKRMGVSGGLTLPTVVINTETFATTGMSKVFKNSISEAVYTLIQDYLYKATHEGGALDNSDMDVTINYLVVLKNMLRPSGHRNTPFNKHMLAIQFLKFELCLEHYMMLGLTSVDTQRLSEFRVDEDMCYYIYTSNAVLRGESKTTSGEDMRKCLFSEGVPNWALPRMNYVLKKLKGRYKNDMVDPLSIHTNPNYFAAIINYVLSSYNTVVSEAVKHLDIRHVREADAVSDIKVMFPVEEAAMVCADVETENLCLHEADTEEFKFNNDYDNIIGMLLIAHNSRWLTSGYTSVPSINQKLIEYGIFNSLGHTLLIRERNESPFRATEQKCDYQLTTSEYNSRDTAIHNYLAINTLDGGMAVIANHDGKYFVIGITPVGTKTINTPNTRVPIYKGSSGDDVVIYSIRNVTTNLMELCRVLGARPRTILASGEMASIALTQAYQRQIGAASNIVDDDVDLCSIAELVRGAWSADIAHRVLAYFSAWISTSNKVGIKEYKEAKEEVKRLLNSYDPSERHKLENASSAVWTWVRNSNITAGPHIDSEEVLSLVNRISKSRIPGGVVQVIHNLVPLSISDVTSRRGSISIQEFITKAASVINFIPKAPMKLLVTYDSDDEDDSW